MEDITTALTRGMTVQCVREMFVKRIRIQSTLPTICTNAGEIYMQLSGKIFYYLYLKYVFFVSFIQAIITLNFDVSF